MPYVRAHYNLVIIVYGSLVAAAGIDYGNEAVVFALHIFVAEAQLAEEFHTSHFKPDEMIGVIDDAHLVGFGVADADTRFVHCRCRYLIYIDSHRCMGSLSSARPLWFPLFEERLDPFAEIGALANAGIFADGGFNLRIEFRTRVIGQQALGIEKREWTVLRQLRREFAGTVEQLLRRNDFVNQAHFQGFPRVEDAAGKQEIAGDFFADLAQEKSRDDGGHESDPHFRVAKLCFRHGQREIAEQSKSGAAGDSRPVDRGNRWFGKFIERAEQANHGSRVFKILLRRTPDQRFRIVEVQAGAEGLPCPGQDQDAGRRVSHFFQGADQIVNQFVADGVALVGPVEGEGGDAGVEGEMERFVVHDSSE